MKSILINILAVLGGAIIGMAINMGLVQTGHAIFPINGVDPNDMDALAAVMPTLEFKYFIFPFLAHALGTFFGAMIAAKIAATRKMLFAMIIGIFFLAGGIYATVLIPAPTWFIVADLVIAYIPMAWIGGRLMIRK